MAFMFKLGCCSRCVFLPEMLMDLSLQGPGPSGKNEEKATVLTEKIEDLVMQVCNKYVE